MCGIRPVYRADSKRCSVCRYKCEVESCEKSNQRVPGLLCPMHRTRRARGIPDDWAKPEPQPYVDSNGYVNVPNNDGSYSKQHRVVMAEHLGRDLLPGENVHHINGVRHDNRIENLELWISTQPSGQRAVDKVAWAREIIALYGDQFPETIAGQK